MAVWDNLNEWQRAYLLTIYHRDQAEEAAQRSAWIRGVRARHSEEWRWLFYGEYDYGLSPLKRWLLDHGLVDQGTGSTFEALRSRGLVLMRSYHDPYRGGADAVHVRMTAAGRTLAREATGEVGVKTSYGVAAEHCRTGACYDTSGSNPTSLWTN